MLRQTEQIGVPLVVYEPGRRSRSSLEAAVYLIFETAPPEQPLLCEDLLELVYKPPVTSEEQRDPRPLSEWDIDKVAEQLKWLAAGTDEVAIAAQTALDQLHAHFI